MWKWTHVHVLTVAAKENNTNNNFLCWKFRHQCWQSPAQCRQPPTQCRQSPAQCQACQYIWYNYTCWKICYTLKHLHCSKFCYNTLHVTVDVLPTFNKLLLHYIIRLNGALWRPTVHDSHNRQVVHYINQVNTKYVMNIYHKFHENSFSGLGAYSIVMYSHQIVDM